MLADAEVLVGTVEIRCPVCDATFPVAVTASLAVVGGGQELVCKPDMTDAHAHMWSHSDGLVD
jgi:hypothetical protein